MYEIIGIDFGVKEYTVAFSVHEKDGTITLKRFEDVKCRDPLTPEEKKKICENYSKKYKAEVRYDATP